MNFGRVPQCETVKLQSESMNEGKAEVKVWSLLEEVYTSPLERERTKMLALDDSTASIEERPEVRWHICSPASKTKILTWWILSPRGIVIVPLPRK